MSATIQAKSVVPCVYFHVPNTPKVERWQHGPQAENNLSQTHRGFVFWVWIMMAGRMEAVGLSFGVSSSSAPPQKPIEWGSSSDSPPPHTLQFMPQGRWPPHISSSPPLSARTLCNSAFQFHCQASHCQAEFSQDILFFSAQHNKCMYVCVYCLWALWGHRTHLFLLSLRT